MGIALGLLIALLLLAALYWLIVVGEATYLGRYAVRFIYQRGAHFYDRARQYVVSDDSRDLLPFLQRALAGRGAVQALDVATGTGRVPLLLAGQPWFRGSIQAIDLAPAMLERARAKIAAAQLATPITLHEGEAGALPWPDATFDMVTSLEALEFFPRPRRALAEMARVLRPGGALIVSKYPDPWARTLPLKGLTRRQIARHLARLGLTAIEVHGWQPGHYELVTATKMQISDPHLSADS